MSATTSPMVALQRLKVALANVSGVASCNIGIEANMAPEDYPMVRIVPSLVRYGQMLQNRTTEVLIYFGQPVHEFEAGLEAIYDGLFDLEGKLLDACTASGVYFQYQETVADEDRVDGYKLMAIRAVVG